MGTWRKVCGAIINILLGGRRNGKTLQLIVYSNITGYPILCNNQRQIDRIKSLAKLNNLEIPEPVKNFKEGNFFA